MNTNFNKFYQTHGYQVQDYNAREQDYQNETYYFVKTFTLFFLKHEKHNAVNYEDGFINDWANINASTFKRSNNWQVNQDRKC